MEALPIEKGRAFSVQRRVLDGVKYTLHFEWNMRAGWFFGLSDADDVPIFGLRKLVTGTDLLAAYRYDSRCPPGQLFLIDTTGQQREPGYDDLASGPDESNLEGTHVLVYTNTLDV